MPQDIAIVLGANVVSDEVRLTLEKTKLGDLGRAKRVEVGKEETTLIGGAGTAAAIQKRIAAVRRGQPFEPGAGRAPGEHSGPACQVRARAAHESQVRAH